MAAVLGGTQSLHCNGRDEALGAADRGRGAARAAHAADHRRARPASRTRSIRSAARTPSKQLTDEIEAAPRSCSTRIDASAARSRAIETGLIQREIQESAYRAQQAIDSGEAIVVGVNRFADRRRDGADVDVFHIDPDIERQQIERVRAVRARRDAARLAAGARGA